MQIRRIDFDGQDVAVGKPLPGKWGENAPGYIVRRIFMQLAQQWVELPGRDPDPDDDEDGGEDPQGTWAGVPNQPASFLVFAFPQDGHADFRKRAIVVQLFVDESRVSFMEREGTHEEVFSLLKQASESERLAFEEEEEAPSPTGTEGGA